MGVLTINTKPLIPNKTNLLILLHIFSANLQQPQMHSHSYVQQSAASHLQFVTTSLDVSLGNNFKDRISILQFHDIQLELPIGKMAHQYRIDYQSELLPPIIGWTHLDHYENFYFIFSFIIY